MKTETILWTAVLVYFVVIGALYLLVGGDPVGVTVLLSSAAVGGLVAGWTWAWGRRHGQRVEDRADSDATDSVGVVGVYPTESLRPFALAVGATALVAGVALGSWLSMVGLAIVASQVMLLVHDTDAKRET